jgi:hypothetical protein
MAMTQFQMKSLGTVIAAGITAAVIAGITYAMDLVIFSQVTLAWMFFGGLLAAGLAAFCIAVLSIWGDG